MTNTQNVTELQPRMTREQLIDAARTAALSFLPLSWLMNELANRLDYTSVALCEAMAQRKELAEQNATLREDVASWAKECDRIEERHTKTPTNMHLLEAQRELRELSCRHFPE
jgi:invasion protein IalB